MRNKLFFIISALLCLGMAGWTYRTYAAQKLAYTFYLEMAPADPRALLSGDYMQLRYAFENEAEKEEAKLCAVQETRERKAGELQEITQVGVLKLNEGGNECVFIPYKHGRYRVPHQFYFQEGKGDKYANARYAAVRKIGKNTLSVVALADENFNWIP